MGTAAPLLIKSQSCGHNRVLSSLAFASAFENPVNAQQANAAISHTRVIRVDATGIPTNSTHPRIPGLQGAESYASGGSEPPPPPAQVPHPNMATPHADAHQQESSAVDLWHKNTFVEFSSPPILAMLRLGRATSEPDLRKEVIPI
jgi:hypothetical protein